MRSSIMAVSAIAEVQPIVPTTKHRPVSREDRPQQGFGCPRCPDKDRDYVGTWFYSLTEVKCQGCDHRFSCAVINRSSSSK
jgi:hypothetical protein